MNAKNNTIMARNMGIALMMTGCVSSPKDDLGASKSQSR
jgi:starvation-inducible outer membrane lipoprotein